MKNSIEYSLPTDLKENFSRSLDDWSHGKIGRIWQNDSSVWTNGDEGKWLGWLTIVDEELADIQKYKDLKKDVQDAGFKQVLLMGMGGSSLCPEVLAMTFGCDSFHILDSTVPAQIRSVESRIDLGNTLFIVASKSGSTLEPNCFKQYFFEKVSDLVGRDKAGRQFVAITDPGSKMERIAREDGFRHVMYGKADIGGRFSALSAFGMTAAASMGLDVEGFLQRSQKMVSACRSDDAHDNPGAFLGCILGVCHRAGRDKLTIHTSAEVEDLGAWLEQLIAESTGKHGVAIIPLEGEPESSPSLYGRDRVFAFVSLPGNTEMEQRYREITEAGHPAFHIILESIEDLGQEFFRWEFATAVAGSIMRIDPFDQPDVEAAKIEARKLTDEYENEGKLPEERPFLTEDGLSLFTGDDYLRTLTAAAEQGSIKDVLDAHFDQVSAGDYLALLAYIEMSPAHHETLTRLRGRLLERTGAATCLGFGPRFLHSTGQAYKGGGNNGVFLQITSDDAADIPVPGQKFTFGIVKQAQARGDFQVLVERGRRALRVHLSGNVDDGLRKLAALI